MFSLCFGKIFKLPVFSLIGNFRAIFPVFSLFSLCSGDHYSLPWAVGLLAGERDGIGCKGRHRGKGGQVKGAGLEADSRGMDRTIPHMGVQIWPIRRAGSWGYLAGSWSEATLRVKLSF